METGLAGKVASKHSLPVWIAASATIATIAIAIAGDHPGGDPVVHGDRFMGVLFLAGRRAKAIPFESTAVQSCRTRDRLDRRRRDSVVAAGRPPFGSICRRNIHSQQRKSASSIMSIRFGWS